MLFRSHGWRLLPFYRWDTTASRWRYLGREVELPVVLSDFSMASLDYGHSRPRCNTPLDHYLELAEAELCRDRNVELAEELVLPAECESLRWFALPQEITTALTAEQNINSVVA